MAKQRRERLVQQFASRALDKSKPSASINTPRAPLGLNALAREVSSRRGRDVGLGRAAAQITAASAPAQYRQGQAATPAQTAQWTRTVGREKAPQRGERAYSTFQTTNTQKGNPRAGQRRSTFVKRDESGDIYRYNQYIDPKTKKRSVFRVGGPTNRKLT